MTFFETDRNLQHICDRTLNQASEKFGIELNQLALTLLVYDRASIIDTATDPATFWSRKVRGYSHRGAELVYPASIVKLFYLVALQEWLDKNMLPSSAELERSRRDMIVDSSNDATSLIVDALTGTTSGMEIPKEPFNTWKLQRQIVNRYFNRLEVPDYRYINVCQKTWSDGPYGRERAYYGDNMENRNLLTTNATAHLLHSIISGMAVYDPTNPAKNHGEVMRQLLQRSLKPEDLDADPENQVTGFLGAALPPDAVLWSKAGLTSKVRHDAIYVEIPKKSAFTLVVFTEDYAKNIEILPFICSNLQNFA
jgi:hypothetical protein